MAEFILMSGISGSGKSTIARTFQQERPGSAVVSRDDIRISVFGAEFGKNVDEQVVTEIEFESIRSALAAGHDVISDNTNLHPNNAAERFSLAVAAGARLKLVRVEASLEQALSRNKSRFNSGGRFVPEEVISHQYQKYVNWKEDVEAIYLTLLEQHY